MATRRKLILAALALVGATTGLALWQTTSPTLERVARRISELDEVGAVHWLASDDVLYQPWEPRGLPHPQPGLKVFNLHTGQQRSISPSPYNQTFLSPSPDGKWLLYGVCSPSPFGFWLLTHPDGTSAYRLPILSKRGQLTSAFWLPNSKGWCAVWWTPAKASSTGSYSGGAMAAMPGDLTLVGYDLKGKVVATEPLKNEEDLKNKTVLGSSSLYSEWRLQCEGLPSSEDVSGLLPPHPGAVITEQRLSYDEEQLLIFRTIPGRELPEHETWEVLLHRPVSNGHSELWLLSRRTGKRRCLVREPLVQYKRLWSSSFTDHDGFLGFLGWSRDGKQVLLSRRKQAMDEAFLLELPTP